MSKSITFTISSGRFLIDGNIVQPNDFFVEFDSPIVLAGKAQDVKGAASLQQEWEIGLKSWNGFNSIPNVSASLYGNNIIAVSSGGPFTNIVIPDGIYSVQQINSYLLGILTAAPFNYPANAVRIQPNSSTGKIEVVLAAGYSVNLNVSNINTFFGFTPAQSPIVGPTLTAGANLARITNGVSAYLLRCDAVAASYLNSSASDVLATYTPNVSPGRSFRYEPYNIDWKPVRNNKEIRRIRVYITDDLGRPVSFRGNNQVGDNVVWEIVLRRVKLANY